MSSYTTELRYICETLAGETESKGYSSIDTILTNSHAKIFDFDYPIFDENYREILEKKILKHYYTREICEESYGLWKLRLDAKMNEIMPYYNKLYESELIEFNPLFDTNLTKQYTLSTVGNSKNNTVNAITGAETDRRLFSDTPQGTINGVENESYLTNVTKNTSSNSTTGDSTSKNEVTNTNTYIESLTGKQFGGSYSKMLKEYRDILLNIDMKIINELNTLFFGLW